MYSVLNRIREIIIATGSNDSEFARKAGIAQSTLANMFSRESEPKAEMLGKIASSFNVNANWLLTGEGSMFVEGSKTEVPAQKGVTIPLLSQKVSCGPGQSWESEQNITEYISLSSLSPALSGRVYGFRVSGTSMLGAGIKDGDIVIFDASPNQELTDGIYVFSLDGDAYCKRLEFDRLANLIKIYSVRVADLEKAELLKTLNSTDEGFGERFNLFGKVFSWLHLNRE